MLRLPFVLHGQRQQQTKFLRMTVTMWGRELSFATLFVMVICQNFPVGKHNPSSSFWAALDLMVIYYVPLGLLTSILRDDLLRQRSNVPFKQLFSWPYPTSALSSTACNTHKRKQISLDTTFWPSSIWLFMLFQLFLAEKINTVSEKKNNNNQKSTTQALLTPSPGFQMLPSSAWFN